MRDTAHVTNTGGDYTYLLTLLDPDLQPEEHVELHELQRRFLEAIVMLPTRYRASKLLRSLLGFEFACYTGAGEAMKEPS